MPSVSEDRKISLRTLHKSSTQYWEKQNGKGLPGQFQRTASMPLLRNESGISRSNSQQLERCITERDEIESKASASSISESEEDMYPEDTESRPYQFISFGFQTKATHDVPSRSTDVMAVLYNGRTRRLILLDTRGISSWLPGSASSDSFKRQLLFPKYKTKLLRTIIFSKKYNVYFTICSDFTLKVYNKDFHETYKTENKSLRSILHLIFNPVTDELISSGVSGTSVWKYTQTQKILFEIIKPMANYELQLSREYPDIGGSWCTKIELITSMQYIFYCSELDLYAYDARDFRKLFTIPNAHSAALTCVGYSSANRVLFTGSVDCEVKAWGASGGHICSLRGHSRAISSVVILPEIPGLVFSSSLDGIIKVWSIDTMDLFYSLSVFSDGIYWMNVTDDGLLWCANLRKVTVFRFNAVVKFWGHARCRIVNLEILEHHKKARRLMAVGEDGSVRLFSQAKLDTLALCTVLPPPVVSLLNNVRDVTHSRSNHLVFILIDQTKLWVYTTKTDPACRIAEWDIPTMLNDGLLTEGGEQKFSLMAMREFEKKKASRRCTHILNGKTSPGVCNCILAVFSENGFQFDTPLGLCSARSRHLLLLGLEDGRLVFADQMRRGMLYCELQASREEIVSIKHKLKQNWLIVQSNDEKYSKFQIRKLPELELVHTIQVGNTTSSFAVLDKLLIAGHSTGHVNVHSLASEDESLSSGSEFNADKQPEHRSLVTDVKSCTKRGIFCSSSADGVIKIWNLHKTLLTEIRLGEELSSCNFLNDHGDLVIGWKRHLFLIGHQTIELPDLDQGEAADEQIEKESVIYEDPSLKYESALKLKAKSSKITMNKYLVPYGFIKTENDDNIELKLDLVTSDDFDGSEKSEETAYALTDTYLSPASSVASFGIIDAIFPPKSPHTQRSKFTDDLMLPEFGVSPGTTPTESVAYSEDDDMLFQEQPEFEDEVFEPQLQEEKVDLGKKLSTGVVVAAALKKMKKKIKVKEEDPHKSRFAGKKIDSKGLMKAGMDAVFAVESMKQRKKSSSTSRERPHSGMTMVKRTRPPSSTSRRRSLRPTQILLDSVALESERSASGDFSQEEVEEIVEKTAEKLKQMGLKLTPQQKVDLPSTRQKRAANSAVNLPKSRPATTRHPVRSAVSNKLKRKISKSATIIRNKPVVPKTALHIVTNNTKPGTAPTLEPLKRTRVVALFDEVGTSGTQSTASGEIVRDSVSPVAHIHMKYRQPAMVNGVTKEGEKPQQALQSQSEKQHKKERDDQMATAMSTPRSDKLFQNSCEEDPKPTAEMKDGDPEENKHANEKDLDYQDVRQLLERCRAGVDEDSGDDDDDEFVLPSLLDYDFHAIYKNDGLQFDEKWQDRMLERYLLMKIQKKQRQEAAMNKRIFLEQERHFKLLASHPELLRKYHEPWFEDPEALADYILNSSLIRGDAAPSALPQYSSARSDSSSRASKRPNTVANNTQRNTQNGLSDKESNFRFSIRPKSCNHHSDTKEQPARVMKRTKSPAILQVAPANKSKTSKKKNSAAKHNLVADRPRSSASIPGKTRYILVKPEKEQHPDKVASPSKLEEQLLRKRFPTQHHSVMRSLGRIEEVQTSFVEEDSIFEPGGRAGTPTSGRTIPMSPSTSRKLVQSETDMLSLQKSTFSGLLGNSELSLKPSHVWKSSFSDAYINPLDIVKRKPSLQDSHVKLSIGSIHA